MIFYNRKEDALWLAKAKVAERNPAKERAEKADARVNNLQ